MEGGHGEVPLPTFPAHGFVHAAGASVLFDHLTEYELVDDGHELAITVLRSFGLISRNANPYREDPAGPEVPVPDAQRIGPWRFTFALMPHAGGWSQAGVLDALERYQHPLLAFRGTARELAAGRGSVTGLEVQGAGVVLSALRRRGDGSSCVWWPSTQPRPRPSSAVRSARRSPSTCSDGSGPRSRDGSVLRLPLGAWEIATVRLR